MNYIEVQKMRKQAAAEFDRSVAAAQKARQQQIAKANQQFTRSTGRKPMLSSAQANKAIDDQVRRDTAAAAAKRQEDATRYNQFVADQRAQAQARAARVNATIARQQRADAAARAKATGAVTAPKPEPRPAARVQPAHMGRTTTGTDTMKDSQGNVYNIQNGKQTLVSRSQQPRLAPKPQTQTNAYSISRDANIRAAAAKAGLKPGQVTRVGYDANGNINRINGIGI